MAKYKNAFHSELDQDDPSYSEELAQEQETEGGREQEGEGGEQNANTEDAVFKKRYSDLRRHAQQKEQQYQDQIDELKQQLDAATKKQLKFPKSEDEIKAWAEKYPEVSKIVETIAGMKANEALQEGEKRMESLKQMEQRITQKEAEAKLLELHPDFVDIREDEGFHEWASEQPRYIQDALYRNNTDAFAAARAIDLYKADTGKGRKRKGASSDPKEAAKAVQTGGGSAPAAKGRPKFSESQVQKMSDAEYEKNEDAIFEAMRKGEFDYDMTGGAR